MSQRYNVFANERKVAEQVSETEARECIENHDSQLRVVNVETGDVPEWSLSDHQKADRFAQELKDVQKDFAVEPHAFA